MLPLDATQKELKAKRRARFTPPLLDIRCNSERIERQLPLLCLSLQVPRCNSERIESLPHGYSNGKFARRMQLRKN